MRIIARRTLKLFIESHPRGVEARASLQSWYAATRGARWTTPQEVKERFGDASILKNGRVVFNICGNRFRLVAWVNYAFGILYIRFIGTHDEYDSIDAETV